jgi:hypothetical protein
VGAIDDEKAYALLIRESADDGSDFTNPPADYRRLFIGEDGDLHLMDPSGAVTDFPVGGGVGAPADGEYLVTAAHGSLSAEKVVTAPASGGVIPKIVRKSANETVNNSAALQDDDELLLALAANEVWEFEALVDYDSGTTPDFKVAFTVPVGATLRWASPGCSDGSGTIYGGSQVTSSGGTRAFIGTGVGTLILARLVGKVINGANAGNLQLQWAQSTAAGSDTTVHANSTLKCWRLL